jgi:hypothetical protein
LVFSQQEKSGNPAGDTGPEHIRDVHLEKGKVFFWSQSYDLELQRQRCKKYPTPAQ